MAVNRPVNEAERDADIARKLQVYGIITGFRNGKVPSNTQIDVALNSFLASKPLASPSDKLSADGKRLVADVHDVVREAKNLLLSKNEGNLIQDFIWQTSQFDTNTLTGPSSPVGKDTAKRDGTDALEGLRTLGKLLITNGQFRKLLDDATVLLRDMAGDAATNAAARVRPSQEQLAQIDSPAEDNTWHEAPDFSRKHLREQAGKMYKGDAKADAQKIANAAAQAPTTSEAVATTSDAVQQKVDENVDEETKQKTNARNEEYRRKTREYLQKKMPQERKDQTIWRLKKMILECQQHPDYTTAVQTLLDLAERYGKHGRGLAQETSKTAKDAHSGFSAAEKDLKTLVERFANGTSSDDLWSAIDQIYRDADRDSELREWFQAMNSYIRRCLMEKGYILEDESTHEWDVLHQHGRYLLREKYRSHTDHVLDEIKFLAEQFDQDPQNRSFAQAVEKLFSDLGHDDNGAVVFKPHLVKDIADIILPGILTSIAYVPLPRLEFTDPTMDLVVENIVLESDNFMPNVAEMYSENFFRLGRKHAGSQFKQATEVRVKGVQMDLRDVSYYIKRKKGFPAVKDQGIVNVLLPGDGFGFKLKVSTADKNDPQNLFKVDKVDVDIKDLKVTFVKSNHKLALTLLKPFVLRALRPIISKVAGKVIREQFNELDKMLFLVKQDANRAAKKVYEEPGAAPNVYQRYMSALQKRLTERKQKAEEVVSDKKVNLAITSDNRILPDVKLPGGVSTKATEYREMARQGDRWESPVFSIGSAQPSSDIPTTPKVTRKPHPSKLSGKAAGPNVPPMDGSFSDASHSDGAQNAGQNTALYAAPNTVPTIAPPVNVGGADRVV